MEKPRPKAPAWAFAILVFVGLLILLPLIVLFIASFLNSDGRVSFENYRLVFLDDELGAALVRSLLVAAVSTMISTFIGTLASLSIYRKYFGFQILQKASLMALVFPEILFAIALLMFLSLVKIPLGLFSVCMAHVGFSLSFVMFAVSSQISMINLEIVDAAQDLGATEFQLIGRILLPLLLPSIGVGLVLSFLLSFDDFLITYFVNGVGADTLPVKLYTAMRTGMSPKLTALSTLLLVVTLTLTLVISASIKKILAQTKGSS